MITSFYIKNRKKFRVKKFEICLLKLGSQKITNLIF